MNEPLPVPPAPGHVADPPCSTAPADLPGDPPEGAAVDWPPPFGPAEWERLRTLDRRCTIDMHRYNRDSKPRPPKGPAPLDFVWRVSLHLRDGFHHDTVAAVHPYLRSAVIKACEEAEGRGWHRAKQAQPTLGASAASEPPPNCKLAPQP